MNQEKITELLGKMVVQLTCEEFCELTRFAIERAVAPTTPVLANGINQLADQLGCSVSHLYMLKAKGVLDAAVISRIGKKVVWDVNKARALAEEYIEQRRGAKK